MLLRLPSPHDFVSQNARAHEQHGSTWQDYAYRLSTGLGHFLRLSLSLLRLNRLHQLTLGLQLSLLRVLRHGGGRQEERNHESEANQHQQSSHVPPYIAYPYGSYNKEWLGAEQIS